MKSKTFLSPRDKFVNNFEYCLRQVGTVDSSQTKTCECHRRNHLRGESAWAVHNKPCTIKYLITKILNGFRKLLAKQLAKTALK